MKSRPTEIAILLLLALAPPRLLSVQQTAANSYQIAFAQITPDGPANVFIADPDGSNVHQVPLGYPAETFGAPVWSPDRTKLLITDTIRLDSSGQCCLFQAATVDLDGANFNQLTPPNPPGASGNQAGCGAWYPDGTRLLCSFTLGPQPGVFSIRVSDGGDPVRLTTYPFGSKCNACDIASDISPDGKRFVFLRFKHENFGPGATEQVALFTEDTDGTGLRQLTPYGVAVPHERASARWSPDGTKIISTMHNGRLFVIPADGGPLTPIQLQTNTQQYFAFQPHWSPDGTRILFCMFINGGEGIFTANPDGSDVTQVTFTTDSSTLYNGPDWGRIPVALQ
jgi:Tol biopolymer transport system component